MHNKWKMKEGLNKGRKEIRRCEEHKFDSNKIPSLFFLFY